MKTIEMFEKLLEEMGLFNNNGFKNEYYRVRNENLDLFNIAQSLQNFFRWNFEQQIHWDSYEDKCKDQELININISFKLQSQLDFIKKYHNGNWFNNYDDLGAIIGALVNQNQLCKAQDILEGKL
jgi:hypothetical protein